MSAMCGIFGIIGHSEASKLTHLALHALQHRGHESAGIVSGDDTLDRHVGLGFVSNAFDEKSLHKLKGHKAIGHVRYSTTGESTLDNAQPHLASTLEGQIALAHNGNLVNADELRKELQGKGAVLTSGSDTELILHLISQCEPGKIEDQIRNVLPRLQGAYSLVVLTKNSLIGVRDPNGYRPLIIGMVDGAYVLASETSVLNLIGGKFVREVEPGEIITIAGGYVHSNLMRISDIVPSKKCVFELIYFARPDSKVFNRSVYETRFMAGQQLAMEGYIEADIVIPVPDSGTIAALGFAENSSIPFGYGLIRSHYAGRTFIESQQSLRDLGVKLKLSTVPSVLEGKKVVVVDDSIVRGTTSSKIVKMIREAGASQVHMRIASPPTKYPCFYGIDTPNQNELIASHKSVEEIREHIAADSLVYISKYGLEKVTNDEYRAFCNACFTGEYCSGKDVIKSRLKVVS